MKAPEQEDIDYWIQNSLEMIDERNTDLKQAYYEKQDLSIQVHYAGKADDYAGLARALTLQGLTAEAKENFSTAAELVLKCFSIAYNINDHDYLGDQPRPKSTLRSGFGEVDDTLVNEIQLIEGINFALMGNDFYTAEQIAHWYQNTPDGYKMDPDVNRYAFAYKFALLNEFEKGKPLLKETIEYCLQNKPKHPGDINFFTLSMTLQGILYKNSELFNEGLQHQLDFYKKTVIPAEDYWDTYYEYICDHAVALANLAIHHGLAVTVEHDLLPKGLLISRG